MRVQMINTDEKVPTAIEIPTLARVVTLEMSNRLRCTLEARTAT
jgi:hypothetical protein